ncbi:MAG: hypothetical protein ACRYFX_21315 [Janthinobacterium lividum]
MKVSLTSLFCLVALSGRTQAPPALAGQTYTAKMREACAETNTGGCWITSYYQLRFGRDSVAVTWLARSVCSQRGHNATTATTAELRLPRRRPSAACADTGLRAGPVAGIGADFNRKETGAGG